LTGEHRGFDSCSSSGKSLFTDLEIPHSVPLLAGRLEHFLPAWEKLTQDQEILSFVKGYEIPFLKQPLQVKPFGFQDVSQGKKILINKEVEGFLRKGIFWKFLIARGNS